MTKRLLYKNIVILFIILTTFSMIDGYIKIPVSVLMMGMIGISFIYHQKAFANKQTIFLLFYFLILFINFLGGSKFINISWLAQEFLIPFTALSIINVLLYTKDLKTLKSVTFAGMVILIILSIPTLILLQLDPNLLRNTISAEDLSPDTVQALAATGIVRYGIIQSLPFLMSFLVLYIKTQNKLYRRLLVLIFLALEFYILVLASFATSIILAIAAILLAAIASGKSNTKTFVVVSVVLAFFAINKAIIVDILDYVQPSFTNTAIYPKISDIKDSLIYGEAGGEVAGREDLYNQSWDTFVKNPLFGNATSGQIGGHSFFIDRLAYFGIIGALPFFLFLFFTFKHHYSLIAKERRIYYLIGVASFIILGLTKNISGIEPFLYVLVFLPGFAFFDRTKKITKKIQ